MPETLCKVLSQPFYFEGSNDVVERQALAILMEHPEQRNNATIEGVKAIHLAALNGHLRVLRELLRLSVNVNEVHIGNRLSVAHFAAMGGRWQIIEELRRQEADFTALDSSGNNILDVAIGAFLQEEKPEQLDFIANLISVIGIRPSKAGADEINGVCLLACRFNNARALRAVYTCGVEVPYVLNQVTGLHLLVEMSLRFLSPDCLDLLHDELGLPMRSTDATVEVADTTEKKDPYELIFDALPTTELLAAPKIFLSGFSMLAHESIEDAKVRANITAREIFARFSLTPNARLRYDDKAKTFYIESLFSGGAKLFFDVEGSLTNLEELDDRLFSLIATLKEKDFFYCDEVGARCGDYRKLLHSHPDLVKKVVANGFELTLEDLHYAIDNCYSEMVSCLLSELDGTLTADELAEVKRKLVGSENDKILSHKSAILSSVDERIARSASELRAPRPSDSELHEASAVEGSIMLSRTGGSRLADDLDTDGTEREVVVDEAVGPGVIKPSMS